ncbi:2-hydroxy-3-oxopropionate reductase [Litorivicinus lipolyticus]|jgi:2-hydroxy-3-oxopropionate reductase|uniref:2-hydroxy-3-oxopropionate reductase n=1 Tax=Litorivicinus lipolyticus TaxID=418701 RepID=UPI003B59D6E5
MSTIGFIGLGIMGAPMVGHLLSAGHSVSTKTHSAALPDELARQGLQDLDSYAAVAAAADVLILMLPNTPQVDAVLFGDGGLAASLRPGTLVIDMSSIDPIQTRDFAAQVEAAGGVWLDAPVSGGQVGAKAASLSIMCGGSASAFERAQPLLALMGKNITHVGPSGAGQIAKVANQMIVALNIEAVAEALVFASKAGADPQRVRQALMGGFASSKILEVHGERMITRSFDPGFTIELHQKDLGLALDSAKSLGLALPHTAGAMQLMNQCVAMGGASQDHSALVRAIENMAGHTIGEHE